MLPATNLSYTSDGISGWKIAYMQTWHRRPEKVLSGEQKNALREKMRPFLYEALQTAPPPNAAILREVNHEAIKSLTVRCERNLALPQLNYFLFYIWLSLCRKILRLIKLTKSRPSLLLSADRPAGLSSYNIFLGQEHDFDWIKPVALKS